MVSTVLCPQCGTKNSKTAEICHKCKKRLKTNKKSGLKSEIFKFNTRSLIDFKIIAVGTIIFILSNVFFLNVAYDYSVFISGFITMIYMYLIFRRSPQSGNPQKELRSTGLKIVLNYLIMAIIGIIVLIALGFYQQ